MVLALTFPIGSVYAALSVGCGAVYCLPSITDIDVDNHKCMAHWFQQNYVTYLNVMNTAVFHQSFAASLASHGEEEPEYMDVPLVRDLDHMHEIMTAITGSVDYISTKGFDVSTEARRDFINRLHYWSRNDCTLDSEVVDSMMRFGNTTRVFGIDMDDGAHNLEYSVWLQLFLKSAFAPLIEIDQCDDNYGMRPLSNSRMSVAAVLLLENHEVLNRRHLVVNKSLSKFELSLQQKKSSKSNIAPLFINEHHNVQGFFEDGSDLAKSWKPVRTNSRTSKVVPLGPLIMNADETLTDAGNMDDFLTPGSNKRKLDAIEGPIDKTPRRNRTLGRTSSSMALTSTEDVQSPVDNTFETGSPPVLGDQVSHNKPGNNTSSMEIQGHGSENNVETEGEHQPGSGEEEPKAASDPDPDPDDGKDEAANARKRKFDDKAK
jgi:hypothetical protein